MLPYRVNIEHSSTKTRLPLQFKFSCWKKLLRPCVETVLSFLQVPNLFPKEDIMTILEMIKPRAKRAGSDGSMTDLYAFFVDQCRINLHMVICMSPFGNAFRTRLRMFPSLVNCCTIDWFSAWPEEALRSVATRFVAEVRCTAFLE
jgi:dynein heavy chain